MGLYQHLVKLLEGLRGALGITPCMLGLGLAYSHVDLLYPLGLEGYADNLLASDLISALVFIAVALLARKYVSLGRSTIMLAAAPLCAVAGIVVLANASAGTLAMAASVIMAVGFTLLYLLWLELYGALAPRQVAVAISGSCLIHVALQGLLDSLVGIAEVLFAALLPLLSVLLYIQASRGLAAAEWPSGKAPRTFGSFPLIVLWVLLFGMATGLGRDAVGSPAGEMIAMAGHGVPAVVLFVGAVLFPSRFDFTMLYRIVAPLMAIGLAMVMLEGHVSGVGELLVDMGSEACTLIMVVVGCGVAYMTRSSGMGWAGLLIGVECAGFAGGALLRLAGLPREASLALAAVLALGFLAATIILFRRENLLAAEAPLGRILDLRTSQAMDVRGFVKRAADSSGLSPAESAVLTLLAQGASREEVSEGLFIAPVTVRVHISHICKKMGLSSSAELDDYLSKQQLR